MGLRRCCLCTDWVLHEGYTTYHGQCLPDGSSRSHYFDYNETTFTAHTYSGCDDCACGPPRSEYFPTVPNCTALGSTGLFYTASGEPEVWTANSRYHRLRLCTLGVSSRCLTASGINASDWCRAMSAPQHATVTCVPLPNFNTSSTKLDYVRFDRTRTTGEVSFTQDTDDPSCSSGSAVVRTYADTEDDDTCDLDSVLMKKYYAGVGELDDIVDIYLMGAPYFKATNTEADCQDPTYPGDLIHASSGNGVCRRISDNPMNYSIRAYCDEVNRTLKVQLFTDAVCSDGALNDEGEILPLPPSNCQFYDGSWISIPSCDVFEFQDEEQKEQYVHVLAESVCGNSVGLSGFFDVYFRKDNSCIPAFGFSDSPPNKLRSWCNATTGASNIQVLVYEDLTCEGTATEMTDGGDCISGSWFPYRVIDGFCPFSCAATTPGTLEECGGHGDCVSQGVCACNHNWVNRSTGGGVLCTDFKCEDGKWQDEDPCSGHGSCTGSVDTCVCMGGYGSGNGFCDIKTGLPLAVQIALGVSIPIVLVAVVVVLLAVVIVAFLKCGRGGSGTVNENKVVPLETVDLEQKKEKVEESGEVAEEATVQAQGHDSQKSSSSSSSSSSSEDD